MRNQTGDRTREGDAGRALRRGVACAVAVALALAIGTDRAAASDRLFPRPAKIVPRVEFWKRVYAEVDTNGGLIHDSEHLDIVYEVIRWPKSLTSAQEEARIARAKKHYVEVLKRLAAERKPHDLEGRRVLALFPPGVSRASLRAAAGRVRFQRGLADRFRDGLIRSGQWEPHIRQVMRDNGLPAELGALPHVESSFNPRVYSKVGAAGLWQFMPSTGRRYLRIDSAVDERMDPWRATEAAAALLRENYRITGAWPLAITAYNHGAGGIMRGVKQVGSRDIAVLIDRYESPTWGFASKNFYTSFLAALDIDSNATRYFGAIQLERPANHEMIVTKHPTSAAALARTFGVDIGLLRELNLALREPVWSGRAPVPKGYAVRLPRVAGRPPAAQLAASLPRAEPPTPSSSTRDGRYKVRRGDTLSGIARKHGLSTASLARANGLRTNSHVRVGQVLKIPGARSASASPPAQVAPASGKPKTSVSARHHTVRRGETLSAISRRTGVSVQELAAANDLDRPYHLQAGQKLRIPAR